MKNRLNITLLVLWLAGSVVCVWNWLTFINIPSFILPVVPAFCVQLLMCRVTRSGWLRTLPALPVLASLGITGFYFVRNSGWDRLAALIFGIATIAAAVGVVLGWLVWWLMQRKKRNISTEEC